MGEEIKASFRWTPEECINASVWANRVKTGRLHKISMKLFGVMTIIVGVGSFATAGLTFQTFLLPIVGIYLLFFENVLIVYLVRRNFNKKLDNEQTLNFTISDDGFKSKGVDIEWASNWNGVRLVRKVKEGYLVYPGAIAYWLPFHAFATPEDQAKAEELLMSKVPDFKNIR
jgi:hypothetical protein